MILKQLGVARKVGRDGESKLELTSSALQKFTQALRTCATSAIESSLKQLAMAEKDGVQPEQAQVKGLEPQAHHGTQQPADVVARRAQHRMQSITDAEPSASIGPSR
ncbi:MAG: hypothetical protein IPK34_11335 [Ramlibacter sp.]|nr:hypothetical protein [Ramlibacter sp.]